MSAPILDLIKEEIMESKKLKSWTIAFALSAIAYAIVHFFFNKPDLTWLNDGLYTLAIISMLGVLYYNYKPSFLNQKRLGAIIGLMVVLGVLRLGLKTAVPAISKVADYGLLIISLLVMLTYAYYLAKGKKVQ